MLLEKFCNLLLGFFLALYDGMCVFTMQSTCDNGEPIIGAPKAKKPRENQPKAAILNKIKCKAAAAKVKNFAVAQNIANYPLIFPPDSA